MKPIISELNITAFRGIKDLSIKNLSTVNVLAGVNNAGKTSVLEAIRFLANPCDLGRMSNLAFLRPSPEIALRQNKVLQYVTTLFRHDIDEDDAQKAQYIIEIDITLLGEHISYSSSGDIESIYTSVGEEKEIFQFWAKIERDTEKTQLQQFFLINGENKPYNQQGMKLYNSLYVHTNVGYYRSCVSLISKAVISNNKDELLGVIKSFDSDVQDISIINDDIYLHSNISGALPLFAYGMGLQKAVLLSAVLSTMERGVVLIDEIDNAINMSAFRDVFSWFIKKCEEKSIQTFVTTHSGEAIDAILECDSALKEDCIRIITLRKTPKTHRTIAKVRTGEEARSDREQFDMELRI